MNELKETIIQMFKDCYDTEIKNDNKKYYYIGGHSIEAKTLDKILSKIPLANLSVKNVLEEFFRGDIPF
jgi:hypothetical protein